MRLQTLLFGFLLFVSATVTAKDSQSNIRRKIQRIADRLQKDNMAHFGYAVGYAASQRQTTNILSYINV